MELDVERRHRREMATKPALTVEVHVIVVEAAPGTTKRSEAEPSEVFQKDVVERDVRDGIQRSDVRDALGDEGEDVLERHV